MARPIEATPPITGDDADRLLDELERVATPSEQARRVAASRRWLNMLNRPPQNLTLILAIAKDGTIGHRGAIPWRLPADMRRFRELTTGHAVIMGRRTWESLPPHVRPLPNRRNIVVSSTLRFDDLPVDEPAPASVWASLDAALYVARSTDPNPFIIGGAKLYLAALPLATKIHLTAVNCHPGGDTRLDLDLTGWREVSRTNHVEHGVAPYSFVDLVRVHKEH